MSVPAGRRGCAIVGPVRVSGHAGEKLECRQRRAQRSVVGAVSAEGFRRAAGAAGRRARLGGLSAFLRRQLRSVTGTSALNSGSA
jgi:hypothetical protein